MRLSTFTSVSFLLAPIWGFSEKLMLHTTEAGHLSMNFEFTSPIGSGHPASIRQMFVQDAGLDTFRASLAQGRWKSEWGDAPIRIDPPGGALIANKDADWKKLTFSTAGLLCATFEAMDNDHKGYEWMQPVFGTKGGRKDGQKSGGDTYDSDDAWNSDHLANSKHQFQFMALPYEAVCTENLTPWLRLLPCRGSSGLASVIPNPMILAAAPYFSLSISASRDGDFVASLAVVIKDPMEKLGYEAYSSIVDIAGMGSSTQGSTEKSQRNNLKEKNHKLLCLDIPVQASLHMSTEMLQSFDYLKDAKVLESPVLSKHSVLDLSQTLTVTHVPENGNGIGNGEDREETKVAESIPFPLSDIVEYLSSADTQVWNRQNRGHKAGESMIAQPVTVIRNMLPVNDGRSVRTYGVYSATFHRHEDWDEKSYKILHFTDSFPWFVQPLWSTLEVKYYRRSGKKSKQVASTTGNKNGETLEKLKGRAAFDFLNWKINRPDGSKSQLTFSFDVPNVRGISVQIDLHKSNVHMEDYSFASEKGFDLGSAAYHLVGSNKGDRLASLSSLSGTANSADAKQSGNKGSSSYGSGSSPNQKDAKEGTDSKQNLISDVYLTDGLMIMVQMPDFSMPFNVLCIASTVCTFFFSQLFRFTTENSHLAFADKKMG